MIHDTGILALQSLDVHEVVRLTCQVRLSRRLLFYYVFLENREENLRHSVLANELNFRLWRPMESHLQGEENL
jgi:hypothetical protein